MSRFALLGWVVGAGAIAGSVLTAPWAISAVEERQRFAEIVIGTAQVVDGTADLQMRFIQEGGPDSGHVRVLLTPQTRPLTVFEARSAAQQAFLETLDEPGLGDDLQMITVVVRLMPASYVDPGAAELVLRFIFKGGRDWTIVAGE